MPGAPIVERIGGGGFWMSARSAPASPTPFGGAGASEWKAFAAKGLDLSTSIPTRLLALQ